MFFAHSALDQETCWGCLGRNSVRAPLVEPTSLEALEGTDDGRTCTLSSSSLGLSFSRGPMGDGFV